MFAASSLSLLVAVVPLAPRSRAAERRAVAGRRCTPAQRAVARCPRSAPRQLRRGQYGGTGTARRVRGRAAGRLRVRGCRMPRPSALAPGTALAEVDLVGTKSFAEVVDKVRAAAAKPPKAPGCSRLGPESLAGQGDAAPPRAVGFVPDHPAWIACRRPRRSANGLMLRAAGIEKGFGAERRRNPVRRRRRIRPALVDNAMEPVQPPALTSE